MPFPTLTFPECVTNQVMSDTAIEHLAPWLLTDPDLPGPYRSDIDGMTEAANRP